MPVSLSPRTEKRLVILFDGSELADARRFLEEDSSDLPGWPTPTPEGLERILFAVLRLSQGSLPRLIEASVLAQTDWRDALVAAGFADDTKAHETWWPESPPTE